MLRKIMYAIVFMSTSFVHAAAPSQVPQTGQTATTPMNPAPVGSDGYLQKGVAWPNPRFVLTSDGSNNCITDNLTGLIWEINPSTTKYGWAMALTKINSGGALPDTLCGFNDWRLPNQNELLSLMNYGYTDGNGSNQSTWLISQGFTNIQPNSYWSSSTLASSTNFAWTVSMTDGGTGSYNKSTTYYVWPVRGGQ